MNKSEAKTVPTAELNAKRELNQVEADLKRFYFMLSEELLLDSKEADRLFRLEHTILLGTFNYWRIHGFAPYLAGRMTASILRSTYDHPPPHRKKEKASSSDKLRLAEWRLVNRAIAHVERIRDRIPARKGNDGLLVWD